MRLKTILLPLFLTAIVGCAKDEVKVICSGSEEIEVDGKVTQTVSTQVALTMTEVGKTSGGYYNAYRVVVGTETMDDGFGDSKTIDASKGGTPGVRLQYNRITNSVKIERWNRSATDFQPNNPYTLKTFSGACK